MSWGWLLLGVVVGVLLVSALGFLSGVVEEWRRVRREYRLFCAMQAGDEEAGKEWYEMVTGRQRP